MRVQSVRRTSHLYIFGRYLVTNLLDMDLATTIRSQPYTEREIRLLIYQILRGLKYIHSAGVIHRVCAESDIHPYDMHVTFFVGSEAKQHWNHGGLRFKGTLFVLVFF